MALSPYALAAVATHAVPGLDAAEVADLPTTAADVDAALVVDTNGRRWLVRSARNASAGATLEAEATMVTVLAPFVASGALPFLVPTIAGTITTPEGNRAMVTPELPGQPLDTDHLARSSQLAESLGAALAAIHSLPVSAVERASHPVYSAAEYRARRVAELDEAEQTGHVPDGLVVRWRERLADGSLWDFAPVVTHGGLAAETVLTQASLVSAVSDWADAQVADPADDVAWILAAAPAESLDIILGRYRETCTTPPDDRLVERAELASELALVRWLLYGHRVGLPDVVADATGLLRDLDNSIAIADGDFVAVPRYAAQAPSAQDDVATRAFALPVPPPPQGEAAEPEGVEDSPTDRGEPADRTEPAE